MTIGVRLESHTNAISGKIQADLGHTRCNQVMADHPGGAEDRVTGEIDLAHRCEDTDPVAAVGFDIRP
jgi:hypothetical protein